MGTPISSIEFPGSAEEYLLRDHRCVDTETGGATSNDYGFVKLPVGTSLDSNGRMNFDNIIGVASPTKFGLVKTGFTETRQRVPLSVDENGNAYVELGQVIESMSTSGVSYPHGNNRWMTFDFTNPNHRSLKIKKGTKIRLDIYDNGKIESRWYIADEDKYYDFSADINKFTNKVGANFYVYLVPDGEEDVKLVISQNSTYPNDVDILYTANNTRKIGQFHTLCVTVGITQFSLIAAAHGSVATGQKYLVKDYHPDDEDGFYNFYNKTVTSLISNVKADILRVGHPLAGFNAGDILPESVWCLSFRPKANPAGMVYDVNTDEAYDIYLQSGTGRLTASEYNKTHTVNREQQNHEDDMLQVSKRLLGDYEFASCAAGSNEGTNIYGSEDVGVVGGHSDTSGQRMISFIGCEECCGYLYQWSEYVSSGYQDGHENTVYDGLGYFGQTHNVILALLFGGGWSNGSFCGSRYRFFCSFYPRSIVAPYLGGRGVCGVLRF